MYNETLPFKSNHQICDARESIINPLKDDIETLEEKYE